MSPRPIRTPRRAAVHLCLLAALSCLAPVSPAQNPAAPRPPLKVAFVYVGPVGDAGWTLSHDAARKGIEREFGNRISTSFVESVREGGEAERVFRDLVGQGNKLIFATSFGYMAPMLKVAADNPDVKFEHATGYRTADNVRTYDARADESAYMAGIVAGAMTKTHSLGVVGALPTPSVVRVINALTLGAQSINPKITVRVIWINDWFNPPRETEAAQTLLNSGADVLMQTTDSPAVLQVAERAGKYAFGLQSDMTRFGPNAHLGSAVINWLPYYAKTVRDALDGQWTSGHVWWGVKEGVVDLIGIPDKVPAAVRGRVDAVRQGLRQGKVNIWQGPMVDNAGKTVLANAQVADDKFLLGMQFYVKGIEGRVPIGGR